MIAPERIQHLVETFEQNLHDYHSHKNETELRRQFLDPFFEALGWDVDNKKGYDERSKEVAHEFSVEIDGQQKKADYAFRTGRDTFDFLVEAKKPSVKIESNFEAAYQLRRYGWSAGLAINVLTDFEHLAIYDCRVRPNYSKDKTSTGLLKLIHYKEYINRWEEIARLFSPEAIRKGALDQYRDDLKGKKGTQEVDDAFLEEIENWRETLARNIASRNKPLNLNEEQVNFAVQMTIDRIIFLRIAEERGMERDRLLFELAEDGDIYNNLLGIFQKADARYNSGLFHFKKDRERENPDTLTPQLAVDDKVLRKIIKDLYYPSPYAFNYIPTEILGSVYERFLGKVIRLTVGGNAKVEEKPEVRKAGGVYYTPSYIVEYIVRNTVGRLLEGNRPEGSLEKDSTDSDKPSGRSMTPDQVAHLKIVDPACGSGSFLLGAYQYLLDWHLDWYVKNDLDKQLKRKTLLTADNKTYRLSIDEKKRILLNNIHGVDLDAQAVEVTKLSLLLKVVEDPGQLKMFEEGHILPNLNQNIRNGNALIGTDYFSGQMFGDMDEMKRVKPFDWKHEFPEVFRGGGFDVVIGNPPYIRIQAMQEWASEQVEFYKGHYQAASKGNYDIYVVFVERGLSLLNPKGRLGFILPHKFFNAQYGEPVRGLISKGKHLSKIVHFGDQQVFRGATTYTCLMFLNKQGSDEFAFTKVSDLAGWRAGQASPMQTSSTQTSEVSETSEVSGMIQSSSVNTAEWNFTVGEGGTLFEKLYQMPIKLSDVAEKIYQGVATSADSIYVLTVNRENNITNRLFSKALDEDVDIESEILHPLLKGAEIIRYREPSYQYKLLFPYRVENGKAIPLQEKELKKKYPLAYDYLSRNKSDLLQRSKTDSSNWWLYPYPKNLSLYDYPKILSQVLSLNGSFSLDEHGKYYFLESVS